MHKLSTILIALAMMLTTIGPAAAHQNKGIAGLLLGGAGGAMVGQAIVKNPEGVIVGSIIGGTLGMLVDLGSARDHVVVIDQPRYGRRINAVSSDHGNNRREGWNHGKHRRYDRQWRQGRRQPGRYGYSSK